MILGGCISVSSEIEITVEMRTEVLMSTKVRIRMVMSQGSVSTMCPWARCAGMQGEGELTWCLKASMSMKRWISSELKLVSVRLPSYREEILP